jgi:hypothetical protein
MNRVETFRWNVFRVAARRIFIVEYAEHTDGNEDGEWTMDWDGKVVAALIERWNRIQIA